MCEGLLGKIAFGDYKIYSILAQDVVLNLWVHYAWITRKLLLNL